MLPVVGVSIGWRQNVLYSATAYTRPIIELGAVAVLLPHASDEAGVTALLQTIDGLLLSGGADIDPKYYGEDAHPQLGRTEEDRDRFELAAARAALAGDLPALGICRGAQLLNVAAHGTLYQDIASQVPGALNHRLNWHDAMKGYWDPTFEPQLPGHPVEILPGTRLAGIVESPSLTVNSFHHQAIKQVAAELVAAARAEDALVEAVEATDHPFVIGVQWHAELMWPEPSSRALFGAFVEACRARRARQARG